MLRYVVWLSFVATTGCQAVWGFEDFERGAGGSGSASATGGVGAGGSGGGVAGTGGMPCTSSDAPPDAVPVQLANGDCIWMDATEVTVGAYETFSTAIEQNPNLAAYTDVPCQDKVDFEPSCGTDAGVATDPELPVTCVDWCDARAYCRFTGKQLCGEPGASESWWQSACTSGGLQFSYPYGSTYDAQACNGTDNIGHGCSPECMLAPAGNQTACKTPSGVFDLSGNASEWVDECSGYSNQNETCAIRGGNVSQSASALACESSQSPPRSTRTPLLGFRCCWRPS